MTDFKTKERRIVCSSGCSAICVRCSLGFRFREYDLPASIKPRTESSQLVSWCLAVMQELFRFLQGSIPGIVSTLCVALNRSQHLNRSRMVPSLISVK